MILSPDGGVQIVMWFQTNLAWLETPARWLSFLGTTECFLLLVPILYWCIDRQLGIRLGVMLIAASSFGCLLKMAFHMPRPYWYDVRVRALSAEYTYGMPSLHAIFAAALWPWLGARIGRRPGFVTGVLLALAVALARVILGVHFPSDVIAGLVLGAAIWWIVMRATDWSAPRLGRAGLAWQIAAAALASLALIGIQGVVLTAIAGMPDPAVWAENAARSGPITPRDPSELISLAGLVLGLGVGLAFQLRWGSFRTDGAPTQRALRFLVGMIGLLLVWQGLDRVFPATPDLLGLTLRYLRYALTGFWALYGAPWLFVKTGLAEKDG